MIFQMMLLNILLFIIRKLNQNKYGDQIKKQRGAFIGFVIITLAFLSFSLFCLVNLTLIDKYPSKGELKYEECTYVNYEYVSVGKGNLITIFM